MAAPGEAKRAVGGDADGESPVKALGDGAHAWAHLGVGLLAPWGRLEHDVEDGQDLLLGVHLAEQCGVDHLRAAWGRPGPSPWRAPCRASRSVLAPAPCARPCSVHAAPWPPGLRSSGTALQEAVSVSMWCSLGVHHVVSKKLCSCRWASAGEKMMDCCWCYVPCFFCMFVLST